MKDKSKGLIKEAKKAAQKSIQENLVIQITEITAKQAPVSKKLSKQITKESRKLAKKISKEIKFDKAALIEVDNQAKETKKVEVTKLVASNGKPKVAAPATKRAEAKAPTV